VESLELIRRLNREEGLAVLAIIHDLNLAVLYFDRLALLNGGSSVASGMLSQVLSERRVRWVFRAPVQVQAHPTHRAPHIIILSKGPQRRHSLTSSLPRIQRAVRAADSVQIHNCGPIDAN
jgi:iron complex transport system ATP-binding protein